MDPELSDGKTSQKAVVFDGNSEGLARSKTAQRMRYEAEVSVIKKKLGGLEDIRKTMNLTQRKIAQLLLVDPSAWTRWTRSGEDAPPHIYRMLQWYLALEEKYPALDTNFWLTAVAQVRTSDQTDRLDLKTSELAGTIETLKRKLEDLGQANESRLQAADHEIRELKKTNGAGARRVLLGFLILAAFLCGFLVRRFV